MIHNITKHRSLIICSSPFQMLIAEKIIALNSEDQFDLLVIAIADNKKFKFYYQRLSKLCINCLYYTEPGLLGFLGFRKQLKSSHLEAPYKNIYLANIDSRHIQYIISKNRSAEIYTFDDGMANIVTDSHYYSNSEVPLSKKIIWRLLGINYYMEDIKNLSKLHYTVYENVPNIINNITFISLYESKNDQPTNTHKVTRFYVGQPLFEISNHFNDIYINQIIKSLGIDYYYPHPRENIKFKDQFKILDSPLLFEDYIIQYLKENPNNSVEVFSFFSSAILNIAKFDRVKVFYIYDEYLMCKYNDFFKLSDEHFNIPIIRKPKLN